MHDFSTAQPCQKVPPPQSLDPHVQVEFISSPLNTYTQLPTQYLICVFRTQILIILGCQCYTAPE